MGKFRVTITLDLDLPKDKNEDEAAATFSGYVVASLAVASPKKHIKDFHFVDCKAEKLSARDIHG